MMKDPHTTREREDNISHIPESRPGPALVQDAGIQPPGVIGTMNLKTMQLTVGDNYMKTASDADKHMGTDSEHLKVYTAVSYLTEQLAGVDQKKSFRYYTFCI